MIEKNSNSPSMSETALKGLPVALASWFVLCLVAVILDSRFGGNMGDFLFVVFLFIGICIGFIYLGFILTCKLHNLPRIIVRSYAIALFFTPTVIVGHGAAFVPAWMVLIGALIKGDVKDALHLGALPIHIVLAFILILRFLFGMFLKLFGMVVKSGKARKE